jgi:hypothetical protein
MIQNMSKPRSASIDVIRGGAAVGPLTAAGFGSVSVLE